MQWHLHEWLIIWLTKRVQQVTVNGHESSLADMHMGFLKELSSVSKCFYFTSTMLILVYPPSHNYLQMIVFCIIS